MALSAGNGPAALVASELMSRGRESAVALEALLQRASTTSSPLQHGGILELTEQILCCLDRALSALHAGGCPRKKRSSPPITGTEARPKRRSRVIGGETPTRIEKRSTPEDGFLWRKYGQKEIVNSKYQRTYFKCAYKHDNGCKATRQVQQSEDDPSVYVVTYFGEHTCGVDVAATATVAQNEKLQPLVINFGSGATSSGSPWPSSSDDDVLSNFSQFRQAAVCLPEEDEGEQKANGWDTELSPFTTPSSSADVSCPSPDLDSLLHNLDWDDCCADTLFDMEFIDFEEAALFQ